MARVEITEDELASGSLPAVCAKSGEPTRHLVAMDIRLPHPTARWLIVAGVIPYLVWRQHFAHRVAARIPLSRAVLDLRRRQHTLLLVVAAGGTVAAAIGIALPNSTARATVIGTGLIFAVGAQIILAGWRREATIRFSATRDGTVVVDRIHPAFRRALAAGERQEPGPAPTEPQPIAAHRPKQPQSA